MVPHSTSREAKERSHKVEAYNVYEEKMKTLSVKREREVDQFKSADIEIWLSPNVGNIIADNIDEK